MTRSLKWMTFALAAALIATPGMAQEDDSNQPSDQVEDVIVVTASRTEQKLHEVPTTITVISAEELETAPADDYGDILRNVPGLNVSQISARDIQITGRAATSSLATNQLVLVDGRTLYLDFFGFVMWDFLPSNPREVKQIEVVRGPGSAVWGANAMTGVINLITRPPKEIVGTSLQLGGGDLGTSFGNITHAGAGDKVSYKLSGGYYEQDPYDRPTGIIPGGPGTPYPPFQNQGTEQPKVEARVDYDPTPGTNWTFSGGYAATDGIIHTGIGPFDIDSSSNMKFFKTSYTRQALQVNFFANILDGEAANLLTVDAFGNPLLLGFESETYNVDFSNTSVVGTKNILTYGATARKNQFDLTIAPDGSNRDEIGVFLQDEILINDKVRWLIGGRVDDMDPIGTVFSPRTALLVSPNPNHTVRLSFNRAFRAPSLINNFLDITIFNAVCLLPGVPADRPDLCATPLGSAFYVFPSGAVGNPDLTEERLDAIELGYTGTFGDTTLSLAVYRNTLKDSTDFFTRSFYSTAAPPPGWPPPGIVPPGVPPQFIPVPPGTFPSTFSYRNIGEIENQGLEFGLNGRPAPRWSWFLNYSYQDQPDVSGIDPVEINTPPESRYNLGLAFNGDRFFVNGNANFVEDARWTDVLDARFAGTTESYSQVNLGLGMRMAGDKVTVSVTGSNIFDEEVQQHVFGDIISRKITGQVIFNF